MSQPFLALKYFVDFSSLSNSSFFPENALELLGKTLTERLEEFLTSLGVQSEPVIKGQVDPSARIVGQVYVAKGATVEPFSFIQGPCYIGPNSEVRHGAYIRGSVYVGEHCVVGHTTEAKGAVFCDHAKAGHFAYVGDSILGQHVNLGAGTKLANLKINKSEIKFADPLTGERRTSGLRKFSAILGDHVQTGCNSVVSPGSLLLPNTFVLPCQHFLGTLSAKKSN